MSDRLACAVIAATPFQILSAINLSINVLLKKYDTDFFFKVYSDESLKMLNRIDEVNKKLHIFRKIYPYRLKSKDKKIRYLLSDFIQATTPKKFINTVLIRAHLSNDVRYDVITVTSGTDFEVAMTRTFSNAKVIAYDDGLGSYVGDILRDNKLRLIWRMLGRSKDKIFPESLYVNNAALCRTRMCSNIVQLPENDSKDYQELLYYIFAYKYAGIYKQHKNIYLTQPIYELGNIDNNTIKSVETFLSGKGIIRIHPRDNGVHYTDFIVDETKNLWELICKEEIDEENLLMGICSSSQIMPKILFGKEPYLVFLYKLFPEIRQEILEKRIIPVVQLINDSYSNKQKILIPSNLNELKDIMRGHHEE